MFIRRLFSLPDAPLRMQAGAEDALHELQISVSRRAVIAEGRPESASRAVSRLIKLRASRSAPALGSRSTQQRERRGHPRPLARNNSVQAESEADQKLEGYFVISQP